MRNIYKVIAVAALALLPVLTVRAQSQAEIEMAKSMARSYGYSESEIEAMVKGNTSGSGAATGTAAVPPAVNRNEEVVTVEAGTPAIEERTAVQTEAPQIYGHNIFQSPSLNFVPSYNIPTPANYRLAAGDEIVIDLWGATYNNYTFTISPEGSITIPNVGPVYIAGNTVENAENRVREKFSTIYSGLSGSALPSAGSALSRSMWWVTQCVPEHIPFLRFLPYSPPSIWQEDLQNWDLSAISAFTGTTGWRRPSMSTISSSTEIFPKISVWRTMTLS